MLSERLAPAARLAVALAGPDEPAAPAFARIVFDAEPAGPADFRVPLAQAWGAPACEHWHYPGPVDHGSCAGVRYARGEELCLLHAWRRDDGGDLATLSREIYESLLTAMAHLGFARIVKAWNYVARINLGEGDAERYKQFCLGRGQVFDARLAEGQRAPAATGIGTRPGEPLTVMLLVSRAPVVTVENPRQVSAFRYPRRYGPRSPNFSRAALHARGDAAQLFISGTASIVGHESRHREDVLAQTDEALANLDSLFREVGRVAGLDRPPRLGEDARLRVYVRRAADGQRVANRIRQRTGSGGALVVLEGDICRRELDVEIDGILPALA